MSKKIELEAARYPVREGLFAGIMAMLILELLTYFVYYYAYEAQKGEIFEGLSRTSNVVQTLVDKDLHRQWRDPAQQTDTLFQDQLFELREALQSDTTIEYIYTLCLDEGSNCHFVMDPTPPGDADGDGVEDASFLMDAWDDPPHAALECFQQRERTFTPDVYYDEWGGHISCFVPLFAEDSTLTGVLGIDISAKTYIERLEPIQEATVRAMMAILFISFLVGTGIWFLRKYQQIISQLKASP